MYGIHIVCYFIIFIKQINRLVDFYFTFSTIFGIICYLKSNQLEIRNKHDDDEVAGKKMLENRNKIYVYSNNYIFRH